MKSLMLIAVIVGLNGAVMAADSKPILGNDGGTSRQAAFPDGAQNSRFGMTNQIQHGSSTWSGSGTGGVMTNLPSSTTNQPSGVMTNLPGSAVNLPSGAMTNLPGSSVNLPGGTNRPNDRLIMP